jgi:pimeloyl-ACP methyl ester carboxylesterase
MNRRIALILALFLACFVDWSGAARAASPPARFSVVTEGKGRDVIFIPGLNSDRKVWDGAVASLGGKYRVHRLQVAGFAGSPAGPNANGELLAPLVEELDAYIKAGHLERPVIVGHSMGGLIALMLASRHPESVGRVLVVDALPFYSLLMSPAATVETAKPQAAQLRDMLATMPEEAYRAQAARSAAMLIKNDAARPAVEASVLASDRRVTAEAVYEVMTTDARPLLGGIKAPVTIAYATNAFAPEATVGPLYRSSYAGASGAKLVPVEDSYHFIMLDQPARFQAILKDVLETR